MTRSKCPTPARLPPRARPCAASRPPGPPPRRYPPSLRRRPPPPPHPHPHPPPPTHPPHRPPRPHTPRLRARSLPCPHTSQPPARPWPASASTAACAPPTPPRRRGRARGLVLGRDQAARATTGAPGMRRGGQQQQPQRRLASAGAYLRCFLEESPSVLCAVWANDTSLGRRWGKSWHHPPLVICQYSRLRMVPNGLSPSPSLCLPFASTSAHLKAKSSPDIHMSL